MPQVWEIVGGGDTGGILVRDAAGSSAPRNSTRLSTGALVEEIQVNDGRLNYKLLTGSGPTTGWVAIRVTGKELAVKTDKDPKPYVVASARSGPQGEEPLPIALLFLGQTSHYVNMLAGVQDMPSVKKMLAQANDILGYDIAQICSEGGREKLSQNRYCEPALFLAGLAGLEKLKEDNEPAVSRCAVMAGFSLGEYTALCAAGVFSFEDGLKLVKLRGEAIQEAAAVGDQAMLSVAGLEEAELQPLSVKCAQQEGPNAICQLAWHLFPKGLSFGGTRKAIEALRIEAESAGAIHTWIPKDLPALHTPLMEPALDKLSVALDETLPRMKSPMHTVWMNVSSDPLRPGCKPEEIVALLKKQLTSPVLWEQSMKQVIKDAGITEFYEVGPHKQLKEMMKRIDRDAWNKTTNVWV